MKKREGKYRRRRGEVGVEIGGGEEEGGEEEEDCP